MLRKNDFNNILVLAFALFAMFFGAGNLIFPPYLGLESGNKWVYGFLCFIAIECGLALLALLAAFRFKDGLAGITGKLGRFFSTVIISAIALCLGPLIAIPRTAATTFELAAQPLVPACPSWIFSAIYFALVAIMCVKQTKIADIVGKILSPIMLAALAVLIVRGTVSPLGEAKAEYNIAVVLKDGFAAGYQTLDMMGAMLLSFVVLSMVGQQGYFTQKKQLAVVTVSGLIASAGLFAVYGGLAYLGASASQVFSEKLDRAELLLAITGALLGDWGAPLMGVIVTAACLTTAIGLVSSSAGCFEALLHGKVKYEVLVAVVCAVSYAISNLGISSIVRLASPLLELIYPVVISLVILSFFDRRIRNVNVYRGAALLGFVAAALSLVDAGIPVSLGTDALPLADIGLQWLLPAVVGGLAGGLFRAHKDPLPSDQNRT
jgi:LIVCS family branched-chain amino acid:cation transporter